MNSTALMTSPMTSKVISYSTLISTVTIEQRTPVVMSDAVLGAVIGGAMAGLILLLSLSVTAAYCYQRQKKVNSVSQNGSTDAFTYVRQFNASDVIGTMTSDPSRSSTVRIPNSSTDPAEVVDPVLEKSVPAEVVSVSAGGDAISVVKDTQSINSLSDDYCDRIVDEAFFAIDNFAFDESHVTSA